MRTIRASATIIITADLLHRCMHERGGPRGGVVVRRWRRRWRGGGGETPDAR